MTPPKEHNNFSVTNPKDMDICDLPDKEFRISVLKEAQSAAGKHRKTIQ